MAVIRREREGPKPPTEPKVPSGHDLLVARAEKWLWRTVGCGVVFRELVANTGTGEIPDVIGWSGGKSILVECKATRSDFLADKKKYFRLSPANGMGDWRFFLCPPEVISPGDLPDSWGLLWAYPTQIKRIAGVPKGNCNWHRSPFEVNRNAEAAMLVSALRRLTLRGHLNEIYTPMLGGHRPDTPNDHLADVREKLDQLPGKET